jgi:hypothetical protein
MKRRRWICWLLACGLVDMGGGARNVRSPGRGQVLARLAREEALSRTTSYAGQSTVVSSFEKNAGEFCEKSGKFRETLTRSSNYANRRDFIIVIIIISFDMHGREGMSTVVSNNTHGRSTIRLCSSCQEEFEEQEQEPYEQQEQLE